MAPKSRKSAKPSPADSRLTAACAKAASAKLGVQYAPFISAWTSYRSAGVAAGREGEACKPSTCAAGRRELLRFLVAVADGGAPPLSLPRGVGVRGVAASAGLNSLLLSDDLVKGAAAWANAQLQRGLNAASVCRSLDSVQRCVWCPPRPPTRPQPSLRAPSLMHSLIHLFTHSFTHSLIHSLTHLISLSLSLSLSLRERRVWPRASRVHNLRCGSRWLQSSAPRLSPLACHTVRRQCVNCADF